jgi:hypothetical protein
VGDVELVEIYDDGTQGANEVAVWKNGDDHRVLKVMVISRPKVHQRRKALTESVFWELDSGLGGKVVSNPVCVGMWEDSQFPYHEEEFGEENSEGWQRICWVERLYQPGVPGDEWRGELYKEKGSLVVADAVARLVIEEHTDAARIALLDFLTGNQDRSARNWITDMGTRFYAIDNGMAWFHEYWSRGEKNHYPEYGWKQGFVVDDVLIQKEPWQFISGVFTTSWAGKPIPDDLYEGMMAFSVSEWRGKVGIACELLGYPFQMAKDWRFDGIMRRLDWMAMEMRFPRAEEYRGWRENGSSLLTPPEVIAAGGQEIWDIDMDYQYLDEDAYEKLKNG